MSPAEQMRENPDDSRHGTHHGYMGCKCRCLRCKAAHNEWSRAWNAANREKRRKQDNASRQRRKAPPPPLNVSPFDRIMWAAEEGRA